MVWLGIQSYRVRCGACPEARVKNEAAHAPPPEGVVVCSKPADKDRTKKKKKKTENDDDDKTPKYFLSIISKFLELGDGAASVNN